jgi:dihydrofolate reductase
MCTLIAAIDEEGLIGRGQTIPWDVPGDRAHFRRLTLGRTVVMGRLTWESICATAPFLEGRVNIVVSRSASEWSARISPVDPEGPHFADSILSGIEHARSRYPGYAEEIFIVGGRQIYEQALARELVDRMVVTRIDGRHRGDVYFPPFPDGWTACETRRAQGFEVIEYRKC